MDMGADHQPSKAFVSGTSSRRLLLVLLCLAALLWVFQANGRVLFYFDSADYMRVGDSIIEFVTPAPDAGTDVSGDGSASQAKSNNDVSLSRSLVYALIAGIVARVDAYGAYVLLQAGLVFGLSWTIASVILRNSSASVDRLALAAVPLIACALSSLPFYIPFLMPDLLAPLGILAAGLITVYGHRMTWPELAVSWAVIVLAATTHLSQLAIVFLLIPITALAALAVPGRRWWHPPLWVASAAAMGLGPIAAAKLAVKLRAPVETTVQTDEATGSQAFFNPFMTARLVVDGPGYAVLEDRCPNSEIATCRLYEALSWSDDPWRLTASHILFEKSERLGSYRRLPLEDQRDIAFEQTDFFLMVLANRPLGVMKSFVINTLQQAGLFSIDMTLPNDQIIAHVGKQYPGAQDTWQHGRLTASTGWVRAYDLASAALYLVSGLALLWLVLKPGPGPDRSVRIFATVVILGLLANALICGGVSQPASRYGARTIWLLPYLAALLALLDRGARSSPGDANR